MRNVDSKRVGELVFYLLTVITVLYLSFTYIDNLGLSVLLIVFVTLIVLMAGNITYNSFYRRTDLNSYKTKINNLLNEKLPNTRNFDEESFKSQLSKHGFKIDKNNNYYKVYSFNLLLSLLLMSPTIKRFKLSFSFPDSNIIHQEDDYNIFEISVNALRNSDYSIHIEPEDIKIESNIKFKRPKQPSLPTKIANYINPGGENTTLSEIHIYVDYLLHKLLFNSFLSNFIVRIITILIIVILLLIMIIPLL